MKKRAFLKLSSALVGGLRNLPWPWPRAPRRPTGRATSATVQDAVDRPATPLEDVQRLVGSTIG